MRNPKTYTKVKTVLFLFIVVFAYQCKEKMDFQPTLTELASQEAKIKCHIKELQDSINMAWDKMNMELEANLPAKMPEEERTNMLKVKNAPLIRMFESFATLEDSIKMKLEVVEMKDAKTVEQVVAESQKMKTVEEKKMELFSNIQKTEKDKVEEAQKFYASELSRLCPN